MGFFAAGGLELVLNPLLVVVGLLDEIVEERAGVELLPVIHQHVQLLVQAVPLLRLLAAAATASPLLVAADLAHY